MKTYTRESFKKEFGEDPVDLFGEDWENYIEEYIEERENFEIANKFGGSG